MLVLSGIGFKYGAQYDVALRAYAEDGRYISTKEQKPLVKKEVLVFGGKYDSDVSSYKESARGQMNLAIMKKDGLFYIKSTAYYDAWIENPEYWSELPAGPEEKI